MPKVCRSCCVPSCIQATKCDGTLLGSGFTIAAKSGGVTVATGTTNSASQWCPSSATLPNGTYDFTVSGTGITATVNPSRVWSATGGVSLTVIGDTTARTTPFTYTVPCGTVFQPVHVSVTGPGGYAATFDLTAPSTAVRIALGATGTYNWSSHCDSARWATNSGTLNHASCASPGSATWQLTAVAGYNIVAGLTVPLSATLHGSDTYLGMSGTFVSDSTPCGSTYRWTGILNYPGCPASSCAAVAGGTHQINFFPDTGTVGMVGDFTARCDQGLDIWSGTYTKTSPPSYVGTISATSSGYWACGNADTWTFTE